LVSFKDFNILDFENEQNQPRVVDIEKSISELRHSVDQKMAQFEETLDTFNLAENHLRVLKDVNKFKKTMEQKVKI